MIVAARLTLSLPASQQPLFLHQCLPQVALSHTAHARYSDHAIAVKDKGHATPPRPRQTYLTIVQSINLSMYIFFSYVNYTEWSWGSRTKKVKTNLESSLAYTMISLQHVSRCFNFSLFYVDHKVLNLGRQTIGRFISIGYIVCFFPSAFLLGQTVGMDNEEWWGRLSAVSGGREG